MTLKRKNPGFIIFGLGRSGSTLLKQLIDSHPDISCEGELLNLEEKYVKNKFLRKLVYMFPLAYFNYRRWITKEPLYGFTLLYYQYSNPKKLLSKLNARGWKFIHIIRKNSLNQSFSQLVAEKTAVWHRNADESIETPKLSIKPEDMLFRLNMVEKNKRNASLLIENLEHHRVVYENDLMNKELWENTCNKIFEFLGVNPAPVTASLNKTYPKPYAGIIENYDELIDHLNKENIDWFKV